VYMFYLIITQKKLADIKNDFINNMSHELKTPISTALAAVQGMQHFNVLEDPQKTSLYLQTTEGELKKLTSMVSKILNNAVFENGSFEIRKQQFDLKVALEELIANHKMINPNASIHLNYTGNEIITGDETYLKIALSNLIDNGIKYAEKDPVLVIECVNALEGIQISVKDNGQGITKDYQERIFEQYFRVPKPDDHSVKGHGLGLAYSRSIIKKHSGTIQLKGSDESGSTFFIFLPK
ncbi:MAG: HAMP domain-containing histidine kinase, partial [Pedobacter sp.]